MSPKEVQAIIDEVDENGDGKMDYNEVNTKLIFISRINRRGYIISNMSVCLCECVFVCLWALSMLNHLTYDLDFWHGC